jgi:hypothetical protein
MPPTPSDPGTGYILDWENPNDVRVADNPPVPPAGWAAEYDPAIRHPDGEPPVRVANAPNEPVRGGQHSVRFHLEVTDPPIQNGSRAELSADPPEQKGVERWYGLSTYLPYTWAPDPAPDSIVQWHQSAPTGGSPPLAIWTRNGRFVVVQASLPNMADAYTDAGPCALQEWTDWVVHVVWSPDTHLGHLQIWRDGSRVSDLREYGPTDTSGAGGNYIKLGIYKWPWSTRGFVPASTVTRRVLYHDQLRIADERGSYSSVAPR